MRISPAYIRNNAQFKHGDPERSTRWSSSRRLRLGAEVPLLAYDLSERLPAIWRPAQDELLCTLSNVLDELQPDSPESLGMREEKPDRLLCWRCSTPPSASTRKQRGLDGCAASSEVISTCARRSNPTIPRPEGKFFLN